MKSAITYQQRTHSLYGKNAWGNMSEPVHGVPYHCYVVLRTEIARWNNIHDVASAAASVCPLPSAPNLAHSSLLLIASLAPESFLLRTYDIRLLSAGYMKAGSGGQRTKSHSMCCLPFRARLHYATRTCDCSTHDSLVTLIMG